MKSQSQAKRPTNLSLDPALISEAKALGVNLSQAAEFGVKRAIAEARAIEWRQQNAQAIASSNAWVEQNGLPFARHRHF